MLSDWLSAWLEADPQARVRLRDELSVSHPELVGEADRMSASVDSLTGFLETPALVLAARELVVDAPVLPAGATVGPYRVVHLLARGGMGDVYRATDSRLGRDVALKMLSPARTGDPRRVERFLLEARITASLDHPNIVRLYDVGRVSEQAYLVAELLDGETLRARILRGPIGPDEARRIALDVARGLAAAHNAGLVHRDLKPENIFLTRTGETKLLDFGIAKLTQDEAVPDGASTLTGVVLGTAGYLAPEQIRGEPVDGRADLFAFGAVLFEMLSGVRAFVRDQIVDTLHSILHDPPALTLESRPGIPLSLATIVGRLLNKAPDARFQTAAELIEALDRADVGRTRSWSARQIARARAGLRRPIWKTAAAAIVVGVVLFAYWQTRPPISDTALAILPVGPAPAADTNYSQTRPGITLAIMPFGTAPVVENDLFALGLADVFIDRLSQLQAVTVLPLSATERHATKDSASAGRALGATHVLTGTIYRDGGVIRATAHLVTVATGSDEPISVAAAASRIFTLQDIVADRVIEALAPNLEATMRGRLRRVGTLNDQAWELCLRARGLVTRPLPTALRDAAELFRQATKIDPKYADAWAGLGTALKRLPVVADVDPNKAFPEARSAAQKALKLDPAHPEALSVLGTVAFWYEWNYPRAIKLLKDARSLKPSSPETQLFLALVLSNSGHPDDAILEIRRAGSFDLQWNIPRAHEGMLLLHAGDHDRALEHLNRVIEGDPNLWLAHLFRAFTLVAKGNYSEAIVACDRMNAARQKAGPAPTYSQFLALKGYALAKLGKTADAEALLKELQSWESQTPSRYVPHSMLALLLHALGRDKEAFAALRHAVAAKDVVVSFMGVAPIFDEWRGLPEFRAALKRANLLEVSDALPPARRQ